MGKEVTFVAGIDLDAVHRTRSPPAKERKAKDTRHLQLGHDQHTVAVSVGLNLHSFCVFCVWRRLRSLAKQDSAQLRLRNLPVILFRDQGVYPPRL